MYVQVISSITEEVDAASQDLLRDQDIQVRVWGREKGKYQA
jgi:hypothetical protein